MRGEGYALCARENNIKTYIYIYICFRSFTNTLYETTPTFSLQTELRALKGPLCSLDTVQKESYW